MTEGQAPVASRLPPRTRRPPRPMCPVDKTDFFISTRTGKRECWGAVSRDGEWHFTREESPGTPWLLYHWPSVRDGSYDAPVTQAGTLNGLREWVARGWAGQQLARCLAERDGWSYTGRHWHHDKTGGIHDADWDHPPLAGQCPAVRPG